eukprot:69564-Rhodomonas_salina.1
MSGRWRCQHDVMELLSSPLVQDAIPCPRCRTFPPFCFDRSYCFAHYVEKRHGNVKCDRCQVRKPCVGPDRCIESRCLDLESARRDVLEMKFDGAVRGPGAHSAAAGFEARDLRV